MPEEYDVATRSGPVPRLIAYLSLCMLAASFGSLLDPVWCKYWALCGAFGLASALGLDVLWRSHARLGDHKRRRTLSLRAKKRLDKMKGEKESSAAIVAAVRQIQPDAKDAKTQRSNSRVETRRPLDKPVTITPLNRLSGTVGESFTGIVRNISRHGFGLAHDRCLDRGLVFLEFELENGKATRFFAELLWCELQADGQYFSGGKLLELVSPNAVGSSAHESGSQADTDW